MTAGHGRTADGGHGRDADEGTVDRAFAAALYSDGDTGLDTGASLLAADPDADTELGRRGEDLLTTAWRRGWQPADVVRLVRRELTGAQERLTVLLIGRETPRHDPLPPRWDGQLRALGARPAASAPGDPLPRAPRDHPDRFSWATAVLELYRLLLRLPAVEPVGPLPGESLTMPFAGEPRTLARIRALLAKAEATTFPEEAEALSAKAQELMARHSVDEALLAARTHAKDVPGACRIGVDAPYETAKAVLLDTVATANHCRAVWNGDLGFSTVVGFASDLDAVELLYTSLLVQGTTAMTRAEAAQRAAGRKRTKTFRQSFLAAYAHRVGDRLTATAREVTSTVPESLPVLAARDVAVAGHADSMFPRTTSTRLRGVTDAAGWDEGTRAGDSVSLRGRGRGERAGHVPGRLTDGDG
ncbi:DUF2786 domain-containing protein [Streptomyces sp. SID4919]|uniref:DUF2786 domain-containing protein n=1 Tax=unclassified Streptomyces TaxID=2593676 RepID=UPI000823DFAF|nr:MULTISPECIES: DUF2786 domain-containing protein [unclassified Streptomyces]MYY08766.1 DUF2786 domain-containing protein [Streptomyces sp. SID4919]SCK25033.1 Protein of unknown function [Streptomyces sp. AmelKG-E11A]